MIDRVNAADLSEASLFGQRVAEGGERIGSDPSVFLNTHEPFCVVTVVVQGGGSSKSHTLASVLEARLIPFPSGDSTVRCQASFCITTSVRPLAVRCSLVEHDRALCLFLSFFLTGYTLSLPLSICLSFCLSP